VLLAAAMLLADELSRAMLATARPLVFIYYSKRLAEAEATVTALHQSRTRSVHQSASLTQANGALSVTDDSVALDDQYTLGAAKKGLKKLRDQLDLEGK